ncbi:hypothetical protein Tco_1153474 [Tanacetum coccineum]
MDQVHQAPQGFTEDGWEDIRARVEADEELTQKLQAEKRDKYSEVDQARMLVDLINQRKRYFTAQKAKAKRNKPMTQAQQRTYMSNYIKHMGREGSEPAEESKDELSQEQLQQLIIIVPEEGMNVEALQTKYPIIDWEVYTEDSRKFNSTEPTEDKERELWVELERLFEPDDNDILWKLQSYLSVLASVVRALVQIILIGTIPTTIPDTTPSVIPPTTHIDTIPIPTISPNIPSSPDYTPASPDYSSASDTKFDPSEDPSSDHIPPLLTTSPFLSSIDDSSDSDIPDIPPSPTHGTPFTETTLSTRRSPTAFGALRRRVHMMTARKRVRPLPTHRLAMRHLVDYSSSDHFSSDDSSRDSSSSSSSESSLDSSMDVLSDSASSYFSSDHSLPTPSSGMRPSHHLCSLVQSVHRSSAISERPSHDSSSTSLSRKRSRSPDASVSLSSPTLGALSYERADLLPSPKRIRSPETATDLEGCLEDSFEPYVPKEARLGVDFKDESSEPSRSRGTDLEMDVDVERSDGIEINPEVQAEIDKCFAYTDALRYRGIDARVVVKDIVLEEIEMGVRGPVEDRVDRVTHPVVADDIPKPAQEGAIEVTYETLGDLVQRFHDHTEEILRIGELERDNRRLRDIVDVKSQRVTRFRRSELRVQRELR